MAKVSVFPVVVLFMFTGMNGMEQPCSKKIKRLLHEPANLVALNTNDTNKQKNRRENQYKSELEAQSHAQFKNKIVGTYTIIENNKLQKIARDEATSFLK